MGSHARVVIAGLSGDAGKTLISLGLCAAWRRAGLDVAAFKKGPDYIDAAWLGWAAGGAARNLDTHLMGDQTVLESFAWHARDSDISLIEGNRGLLDGLDSSGTASTAHLAVLLGAPVVLVVPMTKVTATAAAFVKGCQALEPQLHLAGVILNRVANARQAQVATSAIERQCGVPVLGVLPRLEGELLPSRHLGLLLPEHRADLDGLAERLATLAADCIDLPALDRIAAGATPLPLVPPSDAELRGELSVAYFRDPAFTFYYPENLEAIERAGGRLEPVSPLKDKRLPDSDLLYIGGGFPESYAIQLSANGALRAAVRSAVQQGLYVYAECGGLMYLSEVLHAGGRAHPMSGVLPVEVELGPRPNGHGYTDVRVDAQNPFFPIGTELHGHEFHYSRITSRIDRANTAYAVTRGTGCGNGRDGLTVENVLASYLHLHAGATAAWTRHLFARVARQRRIGGESDASSEEDGKGCQEADGRGGIGRNRRGNIPAAPNVPN